MLLETQQKLEDIVVHTLALHPAITVEQLEKLIAITFKPYSQPAIYQELRKLRKAGIAVKVNNVYSLRIGWVLLFSQFADEMYAAYSSHETLRNVLPTTGTQESWSFTDLYSLGIFWTQLLLCLSHHGNDKEFFEWAPHAWFSLTHSIEEVQFLSAIKIAGIKYYLIIGHETPIRCRIRRIVKQYTR